MRKLAMLGVTLVMFMSWAATVSAATIVYTDKTAWENALGGQFLTEDFADDQLNDWSELCFYRIRPYQPCSGVLPRCPGV